MKTPRQKYAEAREQLEREAAITLTATATLPDGTTAVADWPEGWEAPTYEDADTADGVDLRSDAMDLVFQAMVQLVRAKLGPCPPHTEEEEAELRAKMIAVGMNPDDPEGPFARLKAPPGKA